MRGLCFSALGMALLAGGCRSSATGPRAGDLAGGSGAAAGGQGGSPGQAAEPAPRPVSGAGDARKKARVFFSGHSLMDNPIPDYVLEIASSLGDDFKFNQQIVLGSTINARSRGEPPPAPPWNGYRRGKNREGMDLDVIAELKGARTLDPGEKYDTLVITERHDIVGTIEWEDTIGHLRHFHDRLIDGNAAGTTYFTHTWLEIDRAAPNVWLNHEKNALAAWECVASKVNLTLAAEGRADRIVPHPGGAALVDLVERAIAGQVRGLGGSTPQRLSAIFSDDVHLTALGSYYLALVHYAGIYRRSPVGARVPSGVPSEPAADLQRIAWENVGAYYGRPKPGERTMEECRQVIADKVCSSFWTLRKRTDQIAPCQRLFANPAAEENPFKWPDPRFKPYPAP